ncbi:uncharacterized protein M421DRAFT_57099 [Didymella exigua CBS 183.55]|uniref:Uncharacterized protein n=1 Tax=Didymella exigua CBS 183.55 TaxID=1150837 RepID=A0A6A5RUS1_9PLEO|nr:uncharacterized protein M421DRAFT_57099 [Didymella exigua CBS 183.55]KAF1931120.1 hypothetical protein M421DRAFT_57099 [Didymella exigua CBS 183.55]
MPVPPVASPVTVIEENKSYAVKLECPNCPFFIKNAVPKETCSWEELAPCSWREQSNALLDVEKAAAAISTLRVNGASVLPLGPMPLFVNAYQVADNLTQEALDSIVRAGMLDSDFKGDTDYSVTPALQYEHTLLKTKTPGEWYVQLDLTGMQYGMYPEPLHFDLDRRLVQILVKEQNIENEEGHSLSIEDIQIVERSQRAQPIKMKCGKLAMVKTSFDPNEWDRYGRLGSWSRFWNMVSVEIAQYWSDNIQHNALALPLALMFAFVVFFARIWFQRRQQDKTMDAEYALLDCDHDDLPPAYANIPIIKIEDYE